MASKLAEIYILLGLKKDEFDKGVKSTSSSLGTLKSDFLKAAAGTTAVVAGVAAAGKALYDIGSQGAIVDQTSKSFETLSEKLGLPKDLLEQLRDAANGTIPDMQLMSATATLLAGTSDDLGKALGRATPELLEIAKAANKLNPSLGDTAFLYDSIATGIKRASPMILDNLGLTIKIGEANEKYAASLGKTSAELTAEEKQMALLNATLEAGDLLIAQVGGTTESATDSFQQFEAQTANLKNTLSAALAPAVSDVVSGINDLVSRLTEEQKVLEEVDAAYKAGIITLEEAEAMGVSYLEHQIEAAEVQEQLTLKTEEWRIEMGLTEEQLVELDGHERAYIETTKEAIAIEEVQIDTVNSLSFAIGEMSGELTGAKEANKAYQEAVKAVTETEAEAERMKLLLKLATEELTAAQIEETLDVIDAIDRMEKLTAAYNKGEIAKYDFIGAISDGIITIDEYNALMGISQDEMGILTGDISEAEQAIWNMNDAIVAVEGLHTVEVNVKVTGDDIPKNIPDGGVSDDDPDYVPPPADTGDGSDGDMREGYGSEYFQHGGSFIVPPGFPNDSFRVMVSSGELVTVDPKPIGPPVDNLGITGITPQPIGPPIDYPTITEGIAPEAIGPPVDYPGPGRRLDFGRWKYANQFMQRKYDPNWRRNNAPRILNIYTNAPIDPKIRELNLLDAWARG